MEHVDLNIDNYELKDLLRLFKLAEDFGVDDLKRAKKMVLKMHPDKSNLPSKYFLFFSKAFKTIYNVHLFKNKSSDKNRNTEYTQLNPEDQKESLNHFFSTNEKYKKHDTFNKWFNQEFENAIIKEDAETNGYGEWLKSDEDFDDSVGDVNQAQMAEEFERKKKKVQGLTVYTGVHELHDTSVSCSKIVETSISDYSSGGLFCDDLQYQDLQKAYKESIIPVTMEDYQNVQKFNNINEYKLHRDSQKIAPLSEKQAANYLKEREQIMEQEANQRAYYLASQSEQMQKNQSVFWSKINKLTEK